MMNKFASRYTIFLVFLISLLFTVMTALVGLPTMQGDMKPKIGMPIFTVYQVVLAIIGIFLMKKLNVLDKSDFKFKNAGKGLLLGWVVLILVAILVLTNYSNRREYFITPDLLLLLEATLFPFSTALLEETIYRGLILKILLRGAAAKKKGMIGSFILSAVLFAVVHTIHIIWTDPVTLASDLIFAVAGGMLLGAVYVRTKTLIAPILLHGLLNLSSGIFDAFTSPEYIISPATFTDVITALIVALALITSAFILLKKVKLVSTEETL